MTKVNIILEWGETCRLLLRWMGEREKTNNNLGEKKIFIDKCCLLLLYRHISSYYPFIFLVMTDATGTNEKNDIKSKHWT